MVDNKLQAEEIPSKQEQEPVEREVDEIEAEIKRQEARAETGTLNRIRKMTLLSKLEILIRELEQVRIGICFFLISIY